MCVVVRTTQRQVRGGDTDGKSNREEVTKGQGCHPKPEGSTRQEVDEAQDGGCRVRKAKRKNTTFSSWLRVRRRMRTPMFRNIR